MKKFAIIGVAGYVAPRHLKAIKDLGHELVVAYDLFDGVGILDNYFPNADFFTEFERLDRHIDKLYRDGNPIDYLVVCSPNYLHDAHIRYGLRNDMNVICEKPLVLNPWNLEGLQQLEQESQRKVNTILQLRLHPKIIELKNRIDAENRKDYKINLEYITPRGKWFHYSWKGDISKSGGIATNIGIHFFDMLLWIFGEVENCHVEFQNEKTMKGILKLQKAEVNWFLSIDASLINQDKPSRSLNIDGELIDFSDGFTDLHTLSYQKILNNEGFTISDARDSIELVSKLRKNL